MIPVLESFAMCVPQNSVTFAGKDAKGHWSPASLWGSDLCKVPVKLHISDGCVGHIWIIWYIKGVYIYIYTLHTVYHYIMFKLIYHIYAWKCFEIGYVFECFGSICTWLTSYLLIDRFLGIFAAIVVVALEIASRYLRQLRRNVQQATSQIRRIWQHGPHGECHEH